MNLAKLERTKPDAIVMHPGPIIRGMELSGEIADFPQSVILQQVHNGVAVLDLDNDGTPDLYIANQGAPSTLYHNLLQQHPPAPHWLGVQLIGRPEAGRQVGPRRLASTTAAVGARLELQAGGRLQVREVQGGTGFASQSEYRVLFGMGDVRAPDQLRVRWPSGLEQTFAGADLASCVDGYARLVEGAALQPAAGAALRRQERTP